MRRRYQAISGDSHLDFPPERWTHRVPERWRDRAPRRIKLANGDDAAVIEGRPPFTPGLQVTGVPYQEHDLHGISYDGPGTGSPEQRLREQNLDGTDAEIMYTHPGYPNFWRGLRDNEVYLATIRAYNEWLIEEYASFAPERLMPMAVTPDTGVKDAIGEMEFCKKAGYKGMCLYKFPSGKTFPTPDDDRFWAAALDLQMPVTFHTNGGTTRLSREGPVFQYPNPPNDATPGRDPISLMVRFCGDNAITALQLACQGVFDRFPNLRIYWAETMIGWLPFALYQYDDNYERNRYWVKRQWGLDYLKRKPSEYLKEQNYWGFMDDAFGVRMRHDMGVDHLLWGSDFAHASGDWPHSMEVIDEIFEGVAADDRYRMLAGNANDFFGLKGDFEDPLAEATG